MTRFARAAKALHKLFSTPRGEITQPGFIAAGAVVARGLCDKNGNLTLTGDQGTAPASASAPGSQGTIATDAGYIYVCTAPNTWKRVAIATW